MCLMHTDLPVPDGPRIIEILPSGRPMFRPRRILLRPKALWTSTNSTASGTPVRAVQARVPLVLVVVAVGRRGPRAPRRRASAARRRPARRARRLLDGAGARVAVVALVAVGVGIAGGLAHVFVNLRWGSWVRAPEQLGAEHPDEMHEHDVQHHRLRRRRTHADGSAARVVAVVTADEHDGRGHRHALDDAVEQVGWVLEHPEDQEEAAGGDLADLLRPPPGSWRRSRRRPRRCT